VAAEIRRTLLAMREAFVAGQPRDLVEAEASRRLAEAGFVVDYAVVRRPDLGEPEAAETGAKVALVAARLGRTRLIDNLEW
jgi:pantoate--beta-alanine ligase